VQQHAFISYVHEDKDEVDRVQRILEAAGIPVWRDTGDLWPGEDWKQKIQEAITRNALVFIACFSATSVAKPKTFQNEELVLAIEQFRLRNPSEPWLIPVRLTDCKLPAFDLGAGRTLDSLQRVDLFGTNWDEGAARLVAGVLRVMGDLQAPSTPTTSTSTSARSRDLVKTTLLDDSRRIELEDRVSAVTERCVELLSDVATFPHDSDRLSNNIAGVRFLAEQAKKYVPAVTELAEVLTVGAAWGRESQTPLWKRAMERVASTAKSGSGKVALIDLRRFPLLLLLYDRDRIPPPSQLSRLEGGGPRRSTAVHRRTGSYAWSCQHLGSIRAP
jgi:hypothetical protein